MYYKSPHMQNDQNGTIVVALQTDVITKWVS